MLFPTFWNLPAANIALTISHMSAWSLKSCPTGSPNTSTSVFTLKFFCSDPIQLADPSPFSASNEQSEFHSEAKRSCSCKDDSGFSNGVLDTRKQSNNPILHFQQVKILISLFFYYHYPLCLLVVLISVRLHCTRIQLLLCF
jgi:hypothetical protein